jgi:methyl coenzyme M reductase subunit C
VWGVFVKEKPGNGNGKNRNFSYELRKLTYSERDEIEKNRICLSHVDKPLMAVSKYTLKELVDMGDIFGVQPPPSSSEKTSGNLDMDTLVSEAEINLGVVRKKTSNKKDLEENVKESKKSLEKWKKGDWYENLEIYLSEIF